MAIHPRTARLWWLLFSFTSSIDFVTAAATAGRSIHVYTTTTSSAIISSTAADGPPADRHAAAVARKQQFDLQGLPAVQVLAYTNTERADFVTTTCPQLQVPYQKSNGSMQAELFKWCVLAHPTADRTVVLDSAAPIVSLASLATLFLDNENPRNVAVRDDSLQVVHGSYVQMDRGSSSRVPHQMLDYLASSSHNDDDDLLWQQHQAMRLPKKLYELMAGEKNMWHFLTLECQAPTTTFDRFTCAEGYCCAIQDTTLGQTLFLHRHYVHPPRLMDSTASPSTNNNHKDNHDPFAATIAVQTYPKKPDADAVRTPNLYEILQSQNCLPNHEKCFLCLREKKGATCHSCQHLCGCFCQKLCDTTVPAKHVAEQWTIYPPRYEREPDRRIPRIVHQTWYEALESTKYPNMSRMVESFRQSGWEYRFYTDADAIAFLTAHFPPAVVQAYRVLQPGAFKADLFRYCVLLIYGGVYADVDIQLESALDISIPPDAAFVVPVDEPGRPVNKQMCLWNGLIASVPAHPFLAQSIETIVNQVRNKFTSVDIDATYCPDPELSILHAYDTLFTAGPCLLGASLNRVLQRHWQHSHVPGLMEFAPWGRTIILHQNKWDMGAHRFTNVEQNLVVAATDLPDGDDIANLQHQSGTAATATDNADEAAAAQRLLQEQKAEAKTHPHYSTAHAKNGIYGLEHLYDPNFRAVDEEIRIVVVANAAAAH